MVPLSSLIELLLKVAAMRTAGRMWRLEGLELWRLVRRSRKSYGKRLEWPSCHDGP